MTNPILYSFRRCPYAMRARMSLVYAGIKCEMREILLREKPASMLEISPKGTVPVLQLPDGSVLEESMDIIDWALAQNDKDGWRNTDHEKASAFIAENDSTFKKALDQYKYPDRNPDRSQIEYRSDGEVFLTKLDRALAAHKYLLGEKMSVADFAIFPFIRQFAGVDPAWFEDCPHDHLREWLKGLLESPYFEKAMEKFDVWHPGADVVYFPSEN